MKVPGVVRPPTIVDFAQQNNHLNVSLLQKNTKRYRYFDMESGFMGSSINVGTKDGKLRHTCDGVHGHT